MLRNISYWLFTYIWHDMFNYVPGKVMRNTCVLKCRLDSDRHVLLPTFARYVMCVYIMYTSRCCTYYELRTRNRVWGWSGWSEQRFFAAQCTYTDKLYGLTFAKPSGFVDVLAWIIMTMRRNAFLGFLKGIRDGNTR